MKILILILIASMQLQAGQSAALQYKEWKTFKSELGYELKYPSCWQLIENDVADDSPIQRNSSVGILEGTACPRPKNNPSVPNMLSIQVWSGAKSKEEIPSKIESYLKRYAAGASDALGSRRLSVGDAAGVIYVDTFGTNTIRWNVQIFCEPLKALSVLGPSLHESSPLYAEYLKRIKNGNFEMPEPEKIIFESIRCISPVLKSKKLKK